MSDIKCAKCGEPWDAYGVRNGDMEAAEAERFHKGEGCPSCGFGDRCPTCDGCGCDPDPYGADCNTCLDRGYLFAWEPHKTGHFRAGRFYTGYDPNVREIKDPGFDSPVTMGLRTFPEKSGTHSSRDGHVTEWRVPCPDGPHKVSPCSACGGTGKLTVKDPQRVAFEAAKSACHASDEDPFDILARRGF